MLKNMTKKQNEIWDVSTDIRPYIIFLCGAKRAGKTWIIILAFLEHISRFKNTNFIIGGVNQSSIYRNILADIEVLLGSEIRLDKKNGFKIGSNTVYCFNGENKASFKSMRGFTAAGALLNEVTALDQMFIQEALSRCSVEGSRVFMDTNPESPLHFAKTSFYDKADQESIFKWDFHLDDNEFLPEDYKRNIKLSTPSGMFYERDIEGKWVTGEGVVYKDFDFKKHIVDVNGMKFKKYFAGVDWGYEHFGAINVFGMGDDGKVYLIKEYAFQHKEIDFWVNIAKEIKAMYGNINFWCDTARPEYIYAFQKESLRARKADKAVLSGIESVAKLIKTDKFYISNKAERIKKEISVYAWNERTGEPIKQMDDSLDCARYAIYNEIGKQNKIIAGVRF